MKHSVKGIVIAALVLIVLLVGGLLWKHFITDQILDKGMEYLEERNGMVDGEHTYVDNPVLFEVLEGRWESEDGRWALTITGDAFDAYMSLSLDGERAAEYRLDFTYLLPDSDPNRETELRPEAEQFVDGSVSRLGELVGLYHCAGEDNGTLHLTVRLEDGSEETAVLRPVG